MTNSGSERKLNKRAVSALLFVIVVGTVCLSEELWPLVKKPTVLDSSLGVKDKVTPKTEKNDEPTKVDERPESTIQGNTNTNNDIQLDREQNVKKFSKKGAKKNGNQQNKDNTAESSTEGLQFRTKIPLEPPYQIIQLGTPRSGSTFQYQLLTSLAQWKSPPGTDFLTSSFLPNAIEGLEAIIESLAKNLSFVMKRHKLRGFKPLIMNMSDPTEATDKIAMFTSGDLEQPWSLHHQSRERLVNCSLCEIEYYQPIFGLTDEEVKLVKNHFSHWEKLRQCCGLQSSKYHRMKLHGCDTTPYESLPDYPWCERENITAIELEFAESPIPFFPNDPQFNWDKPGDCDRFDRMMRNGRDFNRQRFYSCEDFKQKWLKE